MCVSYRKLNGATKPVELPIPRCGDPIRTSGAKSNKIWIIGLDARQGYHRISFHHADREKLALLTPDNKKIRSLLCYLGPLTPLVSIQL